MSVDPPPQGYQLVDWDCWFNHYCKPLGLTLYRKDSERKPEPYHYDVIIHLDGKYLTQFYALHWDFIGCLGDLLSKYVETKSRKNE